MQDLLEDPPGIVTDIAPNDFMHRATTPDAYFRGGSSALRAIRLALLAARAPAPRRILDLPSGYGRVTRFLRAQWPDAEIVACDLIEEGARFCAERFGAIPITSTVDPDHLDIPGTFDVIWVGSLVTHLPASGWDGWLRCFERVSHPGTLLLFSVAGRFIEHMMANGALYSLRPDDAAEVVEQARATGFGYADYADQPGYGISLSRADWVVRELLARNLWRLDSYAERALNDHQDIVTATRL